jgi:hypothetical protein
MFVVFNIGFLTIWNHFNIYIVWETLIDGVNDLRWLDQVSEIVLECENKSSR